MNKEQTLKKKQKQLLSSCDICKKNGSFNASDFEKNGLYGFIGFSRDQLNELELSHLNEDSIRCEQCLMIK
jgi:hypothetical protein